MLENMTSDWINLTTFAAFASYSALCIFILACIGILSSGTTRPIFWMLELSFVVVASIFLLLCLLDYPIPHIHVGILATANIAVCIIIVLADANTLVTPNPEVLTMLTAMAPWSMLFWSVYSITGRAKLPWHRRFYLSVLFVLPATQLWYLIPPYLTAIPPDFMLWWNQPMFISMAECIYDSVKVWSIPFLLLSLYRAKWRFTKGSAIAIFIFEGYSIIRLFFPQFFAFEYYLSEGGQTIPIFSLSAMPYYLARFPMAIFMVMIAYFGFTAKEKE